MKLHSLLPAIGLALPCLLPQTSNAAILYTFQQVGNDVVATISGTLNPEDLNLLGNNATLNRTFLLENANDNNQLSHVPAGAVDVYSATVSANTYLINFNLTDGVAATQFIAPTDPNTLAFYGFNDERLIIDQAYNAGDGGITGVEFGGQVIWENTTAAELGADMLSTDPANPDGVWLGREEPSDPIQRINFLYNPDAIVPEPNSTLLSLTALGLLARRKRH